MRRSLPTLIPVATIVATLAAAFIALRVTPALEAALLLQSPQGHFHIVSATSLLALAVASVAGVAAARSPNPRLLLLAAGFISMPALFAVHGLSTPGFIVDERYFGVAGFSARLSLVVTATFLAASAVDWPVARALGRWRGLVLLAVLGGLAVFAGIALVRPAWLPPDIVTSRGFLNLSTGLVVLLSAFAAYRYFEGFRRSQLPMYGAVTIGSVLLLQAQLSLHFGDVWGGTFWLYHVQLLFGFGALVWGVLLEYARGTGLTAALERLSISDPIQQIRAGYHASIVSLASALEARDGYTIGHGARVAALSVLIGRGMQLSPERLRGLAQGALLHDVGKIGVPDAILHKAGPLTAEEFEVIQEHPSRGDVMLRNAYPGAVERAVIRHHHERLDGSGYPDGLAGDAIPLEARIAAVADVYDALRSARSYREAWSRDRAIDQIREGANSHFDPRCVEALLRVVDRWELEHAAEREVYTERRNVA